MTRGNFLLITNTANWMSSQFNGDMYPSGNGKIVYHMLESVKNYNDLTAAILKFDKERFGYSYEYGEDMTPKSISDNIDFSKDYYAVYNSDYLYIKNASDKDCTIIAKNEMEKIDSLNDRLQTIFDECDSLLENLPKGLADEEKEILPPVVTLWSALKKYLEK